MSTGTPAFPWKRKEKKHNKAKQDETNKNIKNLQAGTLIDPSNYEFRKVMESVTNHIKKPTLSKLQCTSI